MSRQTRGPVGNVSLSAVAAIAGVSEATVSRVLNRRYGVAEATRASVMEALHQVGYERPSEGALIALLVPGFGDPVFADLCARIQDEVAPAGFQAIVCKTVPGSAAELETVRSLTEAGIVAAVFVSSSNTIRNAEQAALLLKSRGVPFATVNGGFPSLESPAFTTDDWRAAELAVNHLSDLGHRRIGMCSGPVGNIPADRRVEGFVQAMDALGLPDASDLVVRHHYTVDGGRHAAEELLDLGVTAIIAASDEMALGAIRAIHRKGLRVPRDISVVGHNDSPLLDFTDPPLTTIRQPTDRLAENVGRALINLIADRPIPLTETLLEPELRFRASTAPARES